MMLTRSHRNIAISAFLGLITGVLLTIVLTAVAARPLMVQERRSPFDVPTTVRTITTEAVRHGWRIPRVHDLGQTLSHPAKPSIRALQIVELCNTEYAYDLLKADENRFVATMMPCAIAVYEKQDGHTYVASMNLGLMGKLLGGDVGAVMAKVARDDAEILRFLNR
jgi:uncharacterized protein (DUF302 family)